MGYGLSWGAMRHGGMPRLIRPMLASLRRDLPRDADRYGWEFKWDGVRAVGYLAGGTLRLLSRTGRDITASYPELAGTAAGLDQGQEPQAPGGRHLRLEARTRPPRGYHRLPAARRLRRRAAAVRRARRNRVHPGHARRPEPPAAAPADRHQPVRHAGPGRARPRR